MVKANIRAFKVPLPKHDWVQRWCVACHNVLSSRKLDWETPLSISTGTATNISKFRYHVWEPIWYYVYKTAQR